MNAASSVIILSLIMTGLAAGLGIFLGELLS